MTSKMEQVLADFKDSIEDKEYTFKDLSRMLEVAYKKSFKGKKTKSSATDVKKEPSVYNNFVREEIARIKEQNLEGVSAADYIKIAAERWQAHKKTI